MLNFTPKGHLAGCSSGLKFIILSTNRGKFNQTRSRGMTSSLKASRKKASPASVPVDNKEKVLLKEVCKLTLAAGVDVTKTFFPAAEPSNT